MLFAATYKPSPGTDSRRIAGSRIGKGGEQNVKKRTLDIGLLRSLAATGSYRREIAARMGYHSTYIAKIAAANGIEILYSRVGHHVDCQDWAAKVDALLELHDSGMALDEIAAQMGTTKNAVAGRLWRMGRCTKRSDYHDSSYWLNRNDELIRLRSEGWTDVRIAKHFGLDRRTVNRQRAKLEKQHTPPPRPQIVFPPFGHCLMPSGDMPNMTFCGEPREDITKPYCSSCCRIAYLPPKPVDTRLAA